ncbi:MAG: hypothetical protein ABIN25_05240 [Ginsengibacter sp.]
MHKDFCLISLLLLASAGICQQHGSFEQYYYTGDGTSTVVPKLYYQNVHGWFGSVRYNYEELQTLSFISGKTFSHDKSFYYSITPYAGVVLGKMNGGSLGSNIDIEYEHLFFSSESQYTFSLSERSQNFLFNWSEGGYKFSDLVYAGLAMQSTHPLENLNTWEPGIMLGFTYKNWTFPFYAFSPIDNKRNYVLGINWEWDYTKPKQTK